MPVPTIDEALSHGNRLLFSTRLAIEYAFQMDCLLNNHVDCPMNFICWLEHSKYGPEIVRRILIAQEKERSKVHG